MTLDPPLYTEIVEFWQDAGPAKWFAKDARFDQDLRVRFESLHFSAARGELTHWAETAEGVLALLILTDQIPRNLFRGSAHAYATDPMARAVAERAIERDLATAVEPALRIFFYMPFKHSEAISDHDRAVVLFEAHARETGDQDSLKWARHHREVIERFGRFPHRNAILGRAPRPEEIAAGDVVPW